MSPTVTTRPYLAPPMQKVASATTETSASNPVKPFQDAGGTLSNAVFAPPYINALNIPQVSTNKQLAKTGMDTIVSGKPGANVQAFLSEKISGFDGGDRSTWKEWGNDFLKAFCADNGIDYNTLLPQEKEEIIEELQGRISATWQDSLFGPDTLKKLADLVVTANPKFLDNLKMGMSSDKIKVFDTNWQKIIDFYNEISAKWNLPEDYNPKALVGFETSSKDMGNQLADAALVVDRQMSGTGRCKKGVRLAFEAIGLDTIEGLSAYMAAPQLAKRTNDFAEVKVSREQLLQLPRGSVIVWNSSSGNEHGHIEISQGNGTATSDYTGNINIRNPVSYRVFVPNR
ncbi:MAG: hypothetical protein WCH76_07440 [Candidatus Riflemargulisbacteria bacterium]